MQQDVVKAALNVFQALGRGLTENVYRDALCVELHRLHYSTYKVMRESILPVKYMGYDVGYLREDVHVVDHTNGAELVVELKAQSGLSDAHVSQLLAYMKIRNVPHGILVNFEQRDTVLKSGMFAAALNIKRAELSPYYLNVALVDQEEIAFKNYYAPHEHK